MPIRDEVHKSIFQWITHYQRPFTQHEVESLADHLTRHLEEHTTTILEQAVEILEKTQSRQETIKALRRHQVDTIERLWVDNPHLNA